MAWLSTHIVSIMTVLGVILLLSVGRKAILPHTQNTPWLMWVAFAITAVCGLVLGFQLSGVVGWITRASTLGTLLALPAVAMGWHGVYLLVALIRDVMDGKPDGDARKAALWVPTLVPAGLNSVWTIVTHPRGAVTGVVAILAALVSIGYTHVIVGAALKGKNGKTLWKWFAAAVCLLAGLMTLPLAAYLDGLAAAWFSHTWLIGTRIALGAFGLALAAAALVDIKDRVPDGGVRAFLQAGLPLLILFGAIAISSMVGSASSGGDILTGMVR